MSKTFKVESAKWYSPDKDGFQLVVDYGNNQSTGIDLSREELVNLLTVVQTAVDMLKNPTK